MGISGDSGGEKHLDRLRQGSSSSDTSSDNRFPAKLRAVDIKDSEVNVPSALSLVFI